MSKQGPKNGYYYILVTNGLNLICGLATSLEEIRQRAENFCNDCGMSYEDFVEFNLEDDTWSNRDNVVLFVFENVPIKVGPDIIESVHLTFDAKDE
jgi:protein-arginine kinase activator protein McsA